MGFWSDSSPIVKGVVVVGAIGVIVFALMWMGVGPFATDADDADLTEQRGIQAQ